MSIAKRNFEQPNFFCIAAFFAHPKKVFIKFAPHNKCTPNFAQSFLIKKCVHYVSKYGICLACLCGLHYVVPLRKCKSNEIWAYSKRNYEVGEIFYVCQACLKYCLEYVLSIPSAWKEKRKKNWDEFPLTNILLEKSIWIC